MIATTRFTDPRCPAHCRLLVQISHDLTEREARAYVHDCFGGMYPNVGRESILVPGHRRAPLPYGKTFPPMDEWIWHTTGFRVYVPIDLKPVESR